MFTMPARMIPISPMKRKLRQASRLRLVTVPYTESAKKAPPVTNSVVKMDACVYWKTMLEKTTPESAQKVRNMATAAPIAARCAMGLNAMPSRNQAISATHIAGAECRFPASSIW